MGVLAYLWASCTKDPAPDPCQTPPQITNVAISDASCGSNNGSLQVTASGGKSVLSYSLNGSQFQQSNQFSNLAAGTHVLSVQDENNCKVQQEVVIRDQTNLLVSVSASTTAGCGTANGSVTLAGSGGNGSLAFSLDGLTFRPDASFSNLAAGEHTAYVKDADGCVSNTSFRLTSGVSFEGKIKTIINTNCAIAGCHVSGTGRADFTQFSEIKSSASTIKSRTMNKTMPPPSSGKSLTEEEIANIACWVDDGALKN